MLFSWNPLENARTKVSPNIMKEAVMQVPEHGKSVRATAKDNGIDRKTLGRYVDIVIKGKERQFQANHVSNPIFSQEQENSLKSYLILSAKLHFDLTPLTTWQSNIRRMRNIDYGVFVHVYVFPRVRLAEQMKDGAPPGSLCLTHPRGWMTSYNFELYLEHFIELIRCSTENRVLIVLDNNESHITPKELQIHKNNRLTLVTLSPHTSHRLQPLDRTVFKPFKAYYNVVADYFMHENPGIPININHIPGLVAKSCGKSFTPENIQKGFACTGIWPLNSQIFSVSYFLAANVTHRPVPTFIQEPNQCGSGHPSVATNAELVISRILTSTPANTTLEIEHALRLEKRRKSSQMKPVINVKRKGFMISYDRPTELDKSSEYPSDYSEIDSDKLSDTSEEEPSIKPTSFEVDEYLLVKFSSKKSVSYYADKITKKRNEREFEVKFLRCCNKCFVFPEKDDIADVVIYNMLKLPKPTELSGTERVASKLAFKFNFPKYDIH
ncbi:hypothetical protein PR048_009551 [Dryococelus australis]|uniref:DDE-1 domain-containing protein n=1 Tax=Dryococelus australis TaxID=614101 RepID=A0ABQ9I067_9NEOP|nr:hypothetical protein PR048_009551 [Dryococelus australis]